MAYGKFIGSFERPTEETKQIKEETDLIKRELLLDILDLTESDLRKLKYKTQKLHGLLTLRLMEYQKARKKLEELEANINDLIIEKEFN